MIIDFENDNDPEADRCSEILNVLFYRHCPQYTLFSDNREELLIKFGIWFEEFAPCKIKMSGDGIESIEIEEKVYLMLILKYAHENKTD